MAVDVFLKLADVKGESKDDKHKDEIEVLSWSWGISNPVDARAGAGKGAGKANFHDLNFMHSVDKASPVLMKACTMGDHFKEATLTSRKAGKGQQEYLTFKFRDVLVSSFQSTGTEELAVPTDSVSFNFAKIEVVYTPQNADGSLGAAVEFRYDLKANKTF